MSTRHLLTDIQQQAIVARLLNIYSRLEDVTLANLPLVAFGRCHVDNIRLLPSPIFTLTEFNTLVAWIKLRQSVVVPQDTVSLARN